MNTSPIILRYHRLIGSMYILCMITSILGGTLINLTIQETGHLQHLTINTSILIFAISLEFINALGVLIIAACFYLVFKKNTPVTALIYLLLRSIEVAFCIGAAYIPLLAIVPINQRVLGTVTLNSYIYQTFLLRSMFWDYMYPVLFVSSGFLLYILLYRRQLVPRYICIWGLIALIGVLVSLWIPDMKMIPGLGIIANELYLGIYLMFMGRKILNK